MNPKIDKLTASQQIELLQLMEQERREKVSPKMEQFRQPYRIKIAHGGRGAGAKSTSAVSLLVQRMQYGKIRVCCFREVQRSLEESSWRLFYDTIERLRYKGWNVTREYIESPTGSRVIFRGLVDMRAANQMKSLEGYDIFWIDEAQTVSKESLTILLPTLRKEGSELWATLNREKEKDPIIAEYWDADRDDVLRIALEQGETDNPWFPDVLKKEMETAYRTNYKLALHVWGGQPRALSDSVIFLDYASEPEKYHVKEVPEADKKKIALISVGLDYGTASAEDTETRKGKTVLEATAILEGFSKVYAIDEALFKEDYRADEVSAWVIDFLVKLKKEWNLPIILYAEWAGSNALNKQIQYDIARKGITGISIKNCYKGVIIDRIDMVQLLLGQQRLFFTDEVPYLKEAMRTCLWDSKRQEKYGTPFRLDNGTTLIDCNDSFEYAVFPYSKYISAYREPEKHIYKGSLSEMNN